MNVPDLPGFKNLLATLISEGAREIDVEYDDGEWWVSVVKGSTALGVARYSTEDEKTGLEDALEALRKTKSIAVEPQLYRLSFKREEHFDEPTWKIRIKNVAGPGCQRRLGRAPAHFRRRA